jgi:hypothetical protein
MILWIIQMTFFSIILIFLVHYLIDFFKTTLTVPKVKDLVYSSNQKYENIYNILKNKSNIPTKNSENSENSENLDYTLIDLLPKEEQNTNTNMKNELKHFLKKQMHNLDNQNLETISTDLSYANF